MQKLLGITITLSLIIGVSIAIYQSAKEQIIRDEKKNAIVSAPQIKYQNNQIAKAPVVIEPMKGFFEDKVSENARLHVIGVYQGDEIEGNDYLPWWTKCQNKEDQDEMINCHQKYAGLKSQRLVNVDISYNKNPLILVLMAYDATLWTIDIKEEVNIEGVIVAGYHEQELNGLPTDVKIVTHTYEAGKCHECMRGEGYFYAYQQDQNYQKVISRLLKITGKKPSSFQGAYRAGYFSISNHLD